MRRALIRLVFVSCTLGTGGGALAAQPDGAPRQELASAWRTSVRPDAAHVNVPTVAAWVTRVVPHTLRPAGGSPADYATEGLASYYWQGKSTASGETFDPRAMTAAHKTLAFGTQVRVTHLGNGRSVLVRINDRGPFKPGRIIDLSDAAADALGMRAQGLARVRIDIAN